MCAIPFHSLIVQWDYYFYGLFFHVFGDFCCFNQLIVASHTNTILGQKRNFATVYICITPTLIRFF